MKHKNESDHRFKLRKMRFRKLIGESKIFDTLFRYLFQVSILFITLFRYQVQESILFDTSSQCPFYILVPLLLSKYRYQVSIPAIPDITSLGTHVLNVYKHYLIKMTIYKQMCHVLNQRINQQIFKIKNYTTRNYASVLYNTSIFGFMPLFCMYKSKI